MFLGAGQFACESQLNNARNDSKRSQGGIFASLLAMPSFAASDAWLVRNCSFPGKSCLGPKCTSNGKRRPRKTILQNSRKSVALTFIRHGALLLPLGLHAAVSA